MQAMILAAGRGERMGELTRLAPKPLLRVNNKYLIEYAIESLVKANIKEIVINVCYHRALIQEALGDGSRYGVAITYSVEDERLETGGGIFKALPLLGDKPFIVLSSDVITDYPLMQLPTEPTGLGHLIMVPNPRYHLKGDFGIKNNFLCLDILPTYTFGNVSVLRKELFLGCESGHFRLTKVLLSAIAKSELTGELYEGAWRNVGTPSDL